LAADQSFWAPKNIGSFVLSRGRKVDIYDFLILSSNIFLLIFFFGINFYQCIFNFIVKFSQIDRHKSLVYDVNFSKCFIWSHNLQKPLPCLLDSEDVACKFSGWIPSSSDWEWIFISTTLIFKLVKPDFRGNLLFRIYLIFFPGFFYLGFWLWDFF